MRELGYKRTVHSILAQLIASHRQSVKEAIDWNPPSPLGGKFVRVFSLQSSLSDSLCPADKYFPIPNQLSWNTSVE